MTDVRWADPGDAAAVADRIAEEVGKPGHKRIAVPGGSTPLKVLALLADRSLDWSGVTLCLTDDRQVPDDHPASNFASLSAALGGKGARIERLEEGMAVAPFDLVWVGMGEDGHIASIFPHMVAVIRPGPTVIATTPIPLPPEAPHDRLTLNWAALKRAGEIMLVVTGSNKRTVIDRALRGSESYPVSDVLRGDGPPVTIYWSE
jgi:6-phosphogluconolactonase